MTSLRITSKGEAGTGELDLNAFYRCMTAESQSKVQTTLIKGQGNSESGLIMPGKQG